ncbi:MAG: hypothetical protein Q8N79_00860 [Candidatus Methanoperedens sp.]|nr:hypothetical protein [Candidatus Methanoperedens sp.]
MSQCSQVGRRYHFIKVIPASPSILDSQGLIFQHKFDGVSVEVFIDGDIRIIGRGITKGRQSDYTEKFPELVKDLKTLNLPDGTDFLAEIIVVNQETGSEDFSLIQTRTGRETNIDLYALAYPALMIIHDVVSVGGKDVSELPYFDRLNALKSYVLGKSQKAFFIGNSTDGKAEWEHVEKLKLEGLVIRDPKSRLGKGVWKLKREFTEDVYCKGEYTPSDSSLSAIEYELCGQKKKGVFANLICYQIKDGKEIQIGEVGGGFTDFERVRIQKMFDSSLITKQTPLVLEVKANARYESGKLRHLTFLRMRDDKPWNQCVMQGVS